MGLAPKFKQYISTAFPECAGEPDLTPAAVVVDVMVVLHTFASRPDEDAPALRLAQSLWYYICDSPISALCFDVSATTPSAKSIEWSERPAPSVLVTPSDVEEALCFDTLPDYASLVSSRTARMTLCKWLVRKMAERLKEGQVMLVLDDEDPSVYFGGALPSRRPDLKRSMHGEADVSGIFAARVLYTEFCKSSGVVLCCTSDTDWVLIGALNCFQGLHIRMHHFDRATKQPIFQTVDCWKLARVAPARYGLGLLEWATLVASRGTDFVRGGLIRGVPDWDVYVRGCADAMRAVKKKTGRELVTDSSVDTAGLHLTFVAASEHLKRASLRYERNDGALARLAWNVLYIRNCPERGGGGLDCVRFGWTQDTQGKVALGKGLRNTYSLTDNNNM
jgi:hypothetical protein